MEDIREEGNNIGKAQKQAIELEINSKLQKLLKKMEVSRASKELEKQVNVCKLKAQSEFYLLEKNKKEQQEKLVFVFFINECVKKLPKIAGFIRDNLDSDLTSLVDALIGCKEVNEDAELVKYFFSLKNQLWRGQYVSRLYAKGLLEKRGFGFRRRETD